MCCNFFLNEQQTLKKKLLMMIFYFLTYKETNYFSKNPPPIYQMVHPLFLYIYYKIVGENCRNKLYYDKTLHHSNTTWLQCVYYKIK